MRKIIHCDCVCFYAAVEMRDDPSLLHLPIAIGGKSDRRGVIATCNYKARQFGVHSAMPTGHALRLCPDLVVIPGTMAKYREAAQQIRQIFYRYTDKVEPLSNKICKSLANPSNACLAALNSSCAISRISGSSSFSISSAVAKSFSAS